MSFIYSVMRERKVWMELSADIKFSPKNNLHNPHQVKSKNDVFRRGGREIDQLYWGKVSFLYTKYFAMSA